MSVTGEPVKVEQVSPLALMVLKLLYVKGEMSVGGMLHIVSSSRTGIISAVEDLRAHGLISTRIERDIVYYRLNRFALMSVHVMVAIFDAGGLTSTEKLVALAYAEHGHDDGSEARAGIERICQFTALSRRTVQTTLQSLLAKKVLYVDRPATNRHPTCYRFFLTPDGKTLSFGGAVVAPQTPVGGATYTARGATDDAQGCNSRTQTVKEPFDEPTTSKKIFDDEVIRLGTLLADLISADGSGNDQT